MGRESDKRSWEVTPSHSSEKTAISGTGALIGRPVERQRSYEKIARARYADKQIGRYERYTTKEKASSGERHVERGMRRVGVRDEFKKSSTAKIGDKSGYTEYQVEGSDKRSREVLPSYSSEKTAISGTGALIGRPVEQQRSYEKIARARYEDKQTGRYERYTTKDKASSGERHVERGTRRVGVRDEFKKSSTVKIGSKNGYTEYQVEERIRNVDFGRGGNIKGPNIYASNNIGDSFDDAEDNDDYESGHHDDDFAPSDDYGDGDAAQLDDCYGPYGGCSDDVGDDDAAPNYDCDGGCSDEAPSDDCDDFGDNYAVPSDDCDGGCSDDPDDFGDDNATPSDDFDGGYSDDCGDYDAAPSDDCDGGYSNDDDY